MRMMSTSSSREGSGDIPSKLLEQARAVGLIEEGEEGLSYLESLFDAAGKRRKERVDSVTPAIIEGN